MRFWLPVTLAFAGCGFDDTLVGTPPAPADPEPTPWEEFPVDFSLGSPTDPTLGYALPEGVASGSRGSALAVVGDLLYVADREHGSVVVMSATDLDVRATVAIGAGLQQLVATSDGVVFATLDQSNEVARIDAGALVVSKRMPLDGGPWGIAIDRIGDVWVSLSTRAALVRIDPGLTKVRERFDVPGVPRGVCADHANRVAVVTQRGVLHVIDKRLDSPRRLIDLAPSAVGVGTHALAVAPDPRADRFHAALGVAHFDRPLGGQRGRPITTRLVRTDGVDGLATYDDLAIDQPSDVVHHPTLALAYVISTGDGTVSVIDTMYGSAPLQTYSAGVAPRAIAIDEPGARLYVLQSGTLTVESFDVAGMTLVHDRTKPYADDPLPKAARAGRELFFDATSWRLSGGVACASCHVFGAGDGIAWPVADARRETPLLAGRIVGTAPYGWAGEHATLEDALRDKVRRLGGAPEALSQAELDGLATYISQHLVRPPRPALDGVRGLRTRGETLFRDAGCADCHSGPTYSDELVWTVDDNDAPLNTPSLLEVFASAPYLHDGSAPTLRAVLERHGAGLRADDYGAVVAYLRSL